MKTAIYPGSFDPITYGHIDIIQRSCRAFDKVIVSILDNVRKTPLFSVEERVRILKAVTADIDNIEIDSFSGLLVDYAREKGAGVIIRGLRAITDFEYELQNAQTNRLLSKGGIDTVCFITSLEYSYLSSSTVKEIAAFGGDISGCVPPIVEKELIKKLAR